MSAGAVYHLRVVLEQFGSEPGIQSWSRGPRPPVVFSLDSDDLGDAIQEASDLVVARAGKGVLYQSVSAHIAQVVPVGEYGFAHRIVAQIPLN